LAPPEFHPSRLIAALSRPAADFLALLAGALLPLAFAPVGFYPLAILSPALLFLLWLDVTPKRAMWRGFLFGLGQFGVGVSWIYVAIHDFGYSGVPLAVFLTSLFVAFLALFPALLGYACARVLRGPVVWRLALLFPAAWTLWEWIRGWILTGFPWLHLGYSQIESPLRGLAPLLGVYSVSLAVAFSAGLLVLAVLGGSRRRVVALALGALLWGGSAMLARIEWTEPAGAPIPVALVQGNVPQDTKWRPELVAYTLNLYADLTRQHWDRRLIVWPEAAITSFYHEVADDYLAGLRREARTHNTDIVLGIPVREPGTRRYYNSLLSLSESPGFYHKRHLVPFGDYVPLQEWLRGLIRFFDLPMSGFSAGPSEQPLLEAAGQKIAGTVCYEDVFGEELIPSLPAATLLINATNNAWYGDSLAPHQHLQMSRMRAVETGRTLLRVTTNGVSAIVDPHGRLLARSPQFVTAVLTGEAVPYRGSTPYVQVGNVPVLLFLLAVLALGGWRAHTGAGGAERGVE
jgi:apolipoprotein N-acyltransferase